MHFDQGEFNFDAQGTDAGWRRWREELDAKKRDFELRWGVAIGKPVTVSLHHHAKPITGIIQWIEPPAAQRHLPPTFRIRSLQFTHSEIESIIQQEP